MKFNYFLLVLLLYSCSSENGSTMDYKIEKETPQERFNKISIDVSLKKPISESELEKIAKEIRNKKKNFEKVYIFYRLPKESWSGGAWATTHFEPKMKVRILGETVEESERLKTAEVSGEIIGKWKDSAFMIENMKYLVKEDDKLKMKTVFGDGSEQELILQESKGKIKRYDYKNDNGIYFIIEDNGNLGTYNDEGKYSEGTKLEI